MYNRYWNNTSAASDYCPYNRQDIHNDCPPPPPPCDSRPSEGGFLAGIGETLGARLRGMHFDLDTLIIIIAIYFLLADCDDFDTDLLVLIGVLFLFGL